MLEQKYCKFCKKIISHEQIAATRSDNYSLRCLKCGLITENKDIPKMNSFKNEIVVTQSDITLYASNGTSFTIARNHFDNVRKAIAKSKHLHKNNKHTVFTIQLYLD